MIVFEHGALPITPLRVDPQMRDYVASRKGEWEVVTWDYDDREEETRLDRAQRLCMEAVGFASPPPMKRTRVVFQEKEVPRIHHILRHGLQNQTKMVSIFANLEQAAETLWPTGSLEHMAMRQLSVPILVRAYCGHFIEEALPHTEPLYCCCQNKPRKFHTMFRRCVTDVISKGASNPSGDVEQINATPTGGSAAKESPPGEIPPPPVPEAVPASIPDSSSLATLGACLLAGQHAWPRPWMPGEGENGMPPPPPNPEPAGPPSALGPEIPTIPNNVGMKTPAPIHGGITAEDADIIANEQDRLITVGGAKLVVGQDYDQKDGDDKQIVGVLVAPSPRPPNIYNNSSANILAAKRKRITEKGLPYRGTQADRMKIGSMVKDAMSNKPNRGIFSAARIRKWCEENFHLHEMVSKKWSKQRMESSAENLISKAFPEMDMKCAIKLEPMQEGKAPRLLIVDGDDGQLMALGVIKAFEDLLFDWMEGKSIKHAAKRAAVKRVVAGLTKKGAKLVEGDGKAWDTCCNSKIRSQTEDPILRHIMEVIIEYGVVPEQWHREHMACCEKKELRLFFKKKADKIRIKIDAIRRSGHRGTSCLNWWINFVCWTCSIFKEPAKFLEPQIRKGLDETGVLRWWNGAFEGDDSLCALSPEMKDGDELSVYFMSFWLRQGFHMKIVYVDTRATFCGYHIACIQGEPSGFICPELPRAMENAGVSVSATIRTAALAGDERVVRDIAAASALARAADFAGILPTVSRKFHEYANDTKWSKEVVDREMSYRVMGEEGHDYTALETMIESQNLYVTPTEEHESLKALNCGATYEELDIFRLYPWSFERVASFDDMLASLPISWRPLA
jgi:hypothetical protein